MIEPIADATLAACADRRARFASRLGDVVAVVPAGHSVPRNYRANPYWPFRASSHFLYLVGAHIEGAVLVVDRGAATLFLPSPGADDALWHGPTPTFTGYTQALRLGVAPIEALGEALRGRTLGALAPPDARGQQALDALGARAGDGVVADAIIALRLIHDAAAIDGLRRAGAATAEAHRVGMAATQAGQPAWAVVGAMTGALGVQGMGTSYPPIVSPRGEVLHNHAHHDVLRAGDLLLADVGAETRDGWAGDVTRTWPVSGRFSASQQALYEVVLAAQHAAIDQARPGVRYRDLHLTAARVITEGLVDLGILRGDVAGLVDDDVYALFFPHGIGHIIGLDVHDMEDLGDRAGYAPGRTRSTRFGLGYLRLDRDLEAGMAVTIEPGFYQVPALLEDPARTASAGDRLVRSRLADFEDVRGIRIEDDILITAGGSEVLTEGAPKAVDAVQAAVGHGGPRR